MSSIRPLTDEQQTILSDVVQTSTESPLFRSFVVGPVYNGNTLPLGQSFCEINGKTYAQLESREVPFKQYENSIRIVSQGMIDRISLDSLPIGQYTLSINGHNCSTACYNSVRKCYEFDFSGKRSSSLEAFIDMSHNTPNVPDIPHIERYLNTERIDNLVIFHPSSIPCGEYSISLHGYFPNEYIERTIIKKIYPHQTISLHLNQPTDYIDLFLHVPIGTTNSTILMELDGHEAIRHHIDKQEHCSSGIRIKFNNPELQYMGVQNSYLTEEINKHTLNFSRVSSILITAINCSVVKCVQSRFVIYHYPERAPVFSD